MKTSRLLLLWGLFSLPAFLVTGYLTGSAAACLKSAEVPGGIIALEVAWSDQVAQRIITDWSVRDCGGHSAVHAALRSIQIDYGFIPAYCLFLSLLYLLLSPQDRASRFWLALIWVSGLMDVIENLIMASALRGFPSHDTGAWTYALPSSVKWALLGVTVVYLVILLLRKFFTPVRNQG